jgi:hypothetical protein
METPRNAEFNDSIKTYVKNNFVIGRSWMLFTMSLFTMYFSFHIIIFLDDL